jgi:hypothetical protein
VAETLPPNTHDLDVRVRVTLPAGETVEQQDPFLLLVQDVRPFEGVQIHDVELLGYRTAEAVSRPGEDDLWNWFGGFGRPSFLVLPRVLMHAMPDHWQGRMAKLLQEYDEAFTNWPEGWGTRVQLTQGGKLVKPPQWLLNYRHPDRAAIDQLRPNYRPDINPAPSGVGE